MATAIETLFNDRKLIVYPETGELKLINLAEATMEVAFLSHEGAHALIKALEDYARAPAPDPADEEREAIVRIIGSHVDLPVSSRLVIARSILAAGFRRPAQVEAVIREVVAVVLEQLADKDEGSAAWTENNFLPGPNGDYSIRHHRDSAERLRQEAADWRNGYCDRIASAALKAAFTEGNEDKP